MQHSDLHACFIEGGCYVQVECSAQLELRGCDQGVLLSECRASASGTLLEH